VVGSDLTDESCASLQSHFGALNIKRFITPMKHLVTPAKAILIAAAMLLSTTTSHAGGAPPFLQVGKSYNMLFQGHKQFTVLEIGKDGWVKVMLQSHNEVAWINTNVIPVITFSPRQVR
jgi:hypothetical protein